MVGANIKAETMALMEQRTAMEEEMDGIIQRLCRPGGPGLSGNLVDSEGFPRADIDVAAVRSDRQKLAVLKNDRKEITDRIEKNIHILHSGSKDLDFSLPQKRTAEGEQVPHRFFQSGSGGASSIENAAVAMDEDNPGRLPFAVFDEVAEGSPAARDGIVVGDQLVKFGSVEGGGDDCLRRLALEGQSHENRAIAVIVLRRGVEEHLYVTPRRWGGSGLLGCHIQPLR
ncbi:26S proteasome non-ATPase regulatory subunit 9 isoform X1 [Selaginella moellendorffii]|nr:26S proteasome non-ATPase regulatory subunit 9 isoform X1 [Selaginella moellendorffii]|eukprot:XP_002962940.2 26S proteasome non-ATPase regulatory subunit 9 isoform X1 [Selaginella moellendorffii]